MDWFTRHIDDEQERQRLFPITRKKIFLGHAAVAPLPQVVGSAMADYVHGVVTDFPDFPAMLELLRRGREAAARLLHATPEEIALLGPTSVGLSLFANGIDWQPDDEIVCYQDDYPANVYPWLSLRSRGVQIRYLNTAELGEITSETVAAALTPKTRLVALASCHFVSGYRIDLASIGELLRARGVLFSLDAIQTLGAFPTTVEHVDFLSSDAHKWLLGPLAAGIVFVRRERFDLCRPTLLGSWNIKAPGYVPQDEIEFVDTAQRYEPGAMNMVGIVGMTAAIDLILEAGTAAVADRVRSIAGYLARGLQELGFAVLGAGSRPELNQAGIITAEHATANLAELQQLLAANQVVCSPRQDRRGRRFIRFSPHFYNTPAEIDQVIGILRAAL